MDRGAWQVTVHGIAESDMTATNTHNMKDTMKGISGVEECVFNITKQPLLA